MINRVQNNYPILVRLESPLATVQFKSCSQGRVVEPYSPRDKLLSQSVCRAGQGQQPVTEGASLPGKGLVQRVVDIVQNGQYLALDPFLSYIYVRVSRSAPTTDTAFLTSLSNRVASPLLMLPPQHTTA